MAKVRDPFDELEAAYQGAVNLEKSRAKMRKAEEEGSDDPPADPDNDGREDSTATEKKDNREEMRAQYGDTEPEDVPDEEAERKAAKRQERVTRKSRRAPKCDDCGADVDDGQKFCHECGEKLAKSKGDTTRTIRDSQDAYVRKNADNDDDLHGYREDMGEEEGTGDDDTIITNMGRRTKPAVTKSRRAFFADVVESTGATTDFFDANPGLEHIANIVGDHLAKSERRSAELEKQNARLESRLAKSAQAIAATLRTVTSLQTQIDNVAAQPAGAPFAGLSTGAFSGQVGDLAKSQAARNQTQAQGTKLSKSLVRDRLIKGMRADVVESTLLADFDNYTNRGMTADQWVENALSEELRGALGL